MLLKIDGPFAMKLINKKMYCLPSRKKLCCLWKLAVEVKNATPKKRKHCNYPNSVMLEDILKNNGFAVEKN
ncbi:hypothetical protein GUJ93_ZPchr0014g46499 [Zizania palustris]|uniref:Uncharacterized protein n=1 Tax=Zizania palustris TaxID=103762 RepID=A0A8J5VRZ5_ZIZPA|nr:hypothetical protein GUJ93_ZPchr0014g46499 [Zizania palustris]